MKCSRGTVMLAAVLKVPPIESYNSVEANTLRVFAGSQISATGVTLFFLRGADIPRIAEHVPERLPGLKELRTCYLAVTEKDDICYMQRLIDSSQNHLRPRRMGLVLQPDEMLLEWAYTFEKFRGLGIMSYAMAELAAFAGKLGARWAMTIVEKSNVASLKGCRNAGFRRYQLREQRWRALRTVQTYKLIPTDSKYSFES